MEYCYKILAQNFLANKTLIIFEETGKPEKIVCTVQDLKKNKNLLNKFHPQEIALINYIAETEQ